MPGLAAIHFLLVILTSWFVKGCAASAIVLTLGKARRRQRSKVSKMREETKQRLNQAIWRDRMHKVAIGLAIMAAIGAIMAYQTFDLQVTDTPVGGTVATIEPLVSKTAAATGVNVEVKLDSGSLIRVMALKTRELKVGDHIDVLRHTHGSGRVTHTLK